MPEADTSTYGQSQSYFPALTPQERQEYLDEINGELAVHLSILYFMLEILRGDPSWSDELSKTVSLARLTRKLIPASHSSVTRSPSSYLPV